jgi:hypothetical protein
MLIATARRSCDIWKTLSTNMPPSRALLRLTWRLMHDSGHMAVCGPRLSGNFRGVVLVNRIREALLMPGEAPANIAILNRGEHFARSRAAAPAPSRPASKNGLGTSEAA